MRTSETQRKKIEKYRAFVPFFSAHCTLLGQSEYYSDIAVQTFTELCASVAGARATARRVCTSSKVLCLIHQVHKTLLESLILHVASASMTFESHIRPTFMSVSDISFPSASFSLQRSNKRAAGDPTCFTQQYDAQLSHHHPKSIPLASAAYEA